MFITIKVNGAIQKNIAVSYDSALQLWKPAIDTNSLIGITLEDAYENEETSEWFAPVAISGMGAFLIADENIPEEGGFLHVRNGGKAYVDNSSLGCGTIAPKNISEGDRIAGSLIMVHIR